MVPKEPRVGLFPGQAPGPGGCHHRPTRANASNRHSGRDPESGGAGQRPARGNLGRKLCKKIVLAVLRHSTRTTNLTPKNPKTQSLKSEEPQNHPLTQIIIPHKNSLPRDRSTPTLNNRPAPPAFDTQPMPAYHVCSGRATRGAGGALYPQPATAGWNSSPRQGARANFPGSGVDGRVPRGAGS